MDGDCMLCTQSLLEKSAQRIGGKGHQSLLLASAKRGDNICVKLEAAIRPYFVHCDCFKSYTRASTIQSLKRKSTEMATEEGECSYVPRSKTRQFNFKEHCLYCGEKLVDEVKSEISRRRESSAVATLPTIDAIKTAARNRKDKWGNEVLIRIQTEHDLVSAEAKYHHDCALLFRATKPTERTRKKGRPPKQILSDAFKRLCKDLESNDECQYTLKDLVDKMISYSNSGEVYDVKYLKKLLIQHFEDRVTITSLPGRNENIVTFKDKSHRLLKEAWSQKKESDDEAEKNRLVDLAASIIRDDIQSSIYNCSEYPSLEDTDAARSFVPERLQRFLKGVIKSKASQSCSIERRRISIGHAIVAASRPRSFVSPILLSVAIYIHQRYGSKELISLLNSLGFSDDYAEVQRFLYSVVSCDKPSYSLNGFSQFIFDNADFNVSTISGHDTFHTLGGIACVTPGLTSPRVTLKRFTQVPRSGDIGKFGEIPILTFKKPQKAGLSSLTLSPIRYTSANDTRSLRLAGALDCLWLTSMTLRDMPSAPSWSGFMQVSLTSQGQKFERSRVEVLPFVNLDPSNPSTIYSALIFAKKQSELHDIATCFVTFDQPLYIKAAEIIASSQQLDGMVARLGGFHLLMSFLGSVGFIMTGSGLEDLWSTVYAPASVAHMITGHAFARAMRAHILTSAALFSLLTLNINDKDKDTLKSVHQSLLKKEYDCAGLVQEEAMQNLIQSVEREMEALKQETRTGRLWIMYMEQVSLMKQIVYAERTGDWALHLRSIEQMIPYFHAAGHLAYAKSARLYLEQMRLLPSSMKDNDFRQFTQEGFFTIRRKDQFWGGNFTDQVIEQNLMRLFKTSGGMTRGRGITDSTLTKWVHAFPFCLPVCDDLEKFSNQLSVSSEQHKDLRDCSQIADHRDVSTFMQWLKAHSPFNTSNPDSLMAISTGLVADQSVNCDQAFEIGRDAASAIDGVAFPDVKLKRTDRVRTIGSSSNTVSVRGQDAVINPVLLFNRINCVMNSSSELETYLAYELTPQPPSLFLDGLMRKPNKSVLGQIIKSKSQPMSQYPEDSHFVLDGGFLLHVVSWPPNSTYDDVIQSYVYYVLRNFGRNCTVVFDGYNQSTKSSEHQRRQTSRAVSRELIFDSTMRVVVGQQAFLGNEGNKTRLISMVRSALNANGVVTFQADADADYLIVSSAISRAEIDSHPVVIVGNDTDLLVLLISTGTSEQSLYFCEGSLQKGVFDIKQLRCGLGGKDKGLLAFHAMTGCDSTSSIYGKGKKGAFNQIEKIQDLLSIFETSGQNKEEIQKAGEKIIILLYGFQSESITSLDKLRHIIYKRNMKRTRLSSSFKLESLPPTSAAAKQHSFRVYHTTQSWKGNLLNATDWGWRLTNGQLQPIETDEPIAPNNLLKMVSCACKKGCGRACGCRKMGLDCSPMCTHCEGRECSNSAVADEPHNSG